MKQKNKVNSLKYKKLSIISSIISIVGIVVLYPFFTDPEVNKLHEEYRTVSGSGQNTQHAQISYESQPTTTKELDNGKLSNEQQEVIKVFKVDDVRTANDTMNLKELFKESCFNEHTLDITKKIKMKFSGNLDDLHGHYRKVEEFLNSQLLEEEKVKDYLDFYKKHNEFERAQFIAPPPLWLESPENPEEAIRLKNEKLQYKQELFGEDVADKLWGDEIKIQEYKMRQLQILRDDMYDANVKEQLLKELEEDTFGDNYSGKDIAALNDQKSQLYIKLALYGDNFSNMTNEEINAKIREFKSEIYSPGELKFLNFLENISETEPEP